MSEPIEYVLNELQLAIVHDYRQCLAQVGNGFCKIPVTLKGACFCSKKHSHLETGESREEVFVRTNQVARVDDDVKVLSCLLSDESFSEHREICRAVIPFVLRYLTLKAKGGEKAMKYVKELKATYEVIQTYVSLFKELNVKKEALRIALEITSRDYKSALTSPLSTPNSSPTSSIDGDVRRTPVTPMRVIVPVVPTAPQVQDLPIRDQSAKRPRADSDPGVGLPKKLFVEQLDDEDSVQLAREGGVIDLEADSDSDSDTEYDDNVDLAGMIVDSEEEEDEELAAEVDAEEAVSRGSMVQRAVNFVLRK